MPVCGCPTDSSARFQAVRWRAVLSLGAAVCLWAPGFAANAPEGGEVFRLYAQSAPIPGGQAPDAQAPDAQAPAEASDGQRIRHVTIPTLTVFRPPASVASGVAILIMPGGGFEHLAIANEGYEVAPPLLARGITAIVLKYRVSDRPGVRPPAAGTVARPPSPQTPTRSPDGLRHSTAPWPPRRP